MKNFVLVEMSTKYDPYISTQNFQTQGKKRSKIRIRIGKYEMLSTPEEDKMKNSITKQDNPKVNLVLEIPKHMTQSTSLKRCHHISKWGPHHGPHYQHHRHHLIYISQTHTF